RQTLRSDRLEVWLPPRGRPSRRCLPRRPARSESTGPTGHGETFELPSLDPPWPTPLPEYWPRRPRLSTGKRDCSASCRCPRLHDLGNWCIAGESRALVVPGHPLRCAGWPVTHEAFDLGDG